MAHFVDTGRPGEEPLTGKALTDFQVTCEEKGEPPSPPEWEGLTIEEVATRRAARVAQGGVNGRESKVRYTELDVASQDYTYRIGGCRRSSMSHRSLSVLTRVCIALDTTRQ